jgi:hypothetical protein
LKFKLLLLAGLIATTADFSSAWTQESRISIIKDAIKLMPQNFQIFIEHYHESFWSGSNSSFQSEMIDQEMISRIIKYCASAGDLLKRQENLAEAARMLGIQARLAEKLCSPVKLLRDKPDWQTDYEIYLENHKNRFWIKWKGIGNRPRTESALVDVLNQAQTRVTNAGSAARDSFAQDGIPISSYNIQSVPFGSGSMSYSNAVSAIASIWLYVWDQAGGIKDPK